MEPLTLPESTYLLLERQNQYKKELKKYIDVFTVVFACLFLLYYYGWPPVIRRIPPIVYILLL